MRERVAGVLSASEHPEGIVTTSVGMVYEPVTVVLAHEKPVAKVTVGVAPMPLSDSDRVTVTVSPAARYPIDDGVKPIVHVVAALATAVAPVALTAVTRLPVALNEVGVTLVAEVRLGSSVVTTANSLAVRIVGAAGLVAVNERDAAVLLASEQPDGIVIVTWDGELEV